MPIAARTALHATGCARATALAAALAAAALAVPARAQPQQVRPPIAHYWVDLATHTMAGMPEMPDMPGMPPMPGMPGMPGAGATPGAGAGPGAGSAPGGGVWGQTRHMAMGRHVDLALHTKAKPAGSDATHAIPPGMKMGASLPLVPVQAPPRTREPGEPGEDTPEKPRGRILIYWGCGEAVRPGQPRVIDLAGAPSEFGRAFAGRFAPERGARVGPGHSLWPNERNRIAVPKGASLVGEHAVSGEGVPPALRFAIGAAHDLMPPIELAASGNLAASIALRWAAVPNAHGYFLHAMGGAGDDLILWSSSETADSGMGLFDYLSEATSARWVRERVLLAPSQTSCAIPKGVLSAARDGAMLRMIAYGGELNLVHPPRPADPRTPWEQQWAVRVRTKSTTMAMLGEEIEAQSPGASAPAGPAAGPAAGAPGVTGAPGAPSAQSEPAREAPEKPSAGPIPGLPGLDPGKVLRGIFGR
ncbi:MAG TPA: hypothetical protein VIT02_08085 [Burkholderiaceae bacterium]